MKRLRFPIWGCKGIDRNSKIDRNGQTEKKTDCAGSVTLEAALLLSMFILFSSAMMDLIQIARAQIILQYAVNNAAKEISVYSYVLTKAGITQKRVETSESADEFKGKIGELVSGVKQVHSALDGGSIGGVVVAGKNLYGVLEGLIGEYGEAPGELVSDVVDVGKQWAADKVSSKLIELYVKPRVEECIKNMSGDDADGYLESLGILGGTVSLDYSKSEWAKEKKGDLPVLRVVVEYPVEIKLGWIELPERNFRVCATTAIW